MVAHFSFFIDDLIFSQTSAQLTILNNSRLVRIFFNRFNDLLPNSSKAIDEITIGILYALNSVTSTFMLLITVKRIAT